MAELLSDPDLAYSHGQTCIYFIISDLYFADDGSLKHTVVLKKHWTFLKKHWTFSKIPRDVFLKTTVCFF